MYLRRLLGEAEGQLQPERTPSAQADAQDAAPETPEETSEETPVEAPPDSKAAPHVQELVQQWQAGEHVGVAARLMFTEASYKDFVELIFIIGREGGLELGQLLDELADTERIEPPETPPQYNDLLRRVAGSGEEEGVL